MGRSCSSDIRELGVVAELGGAQREACVRCGWRGQVRVHGGGWVRRERGLELVVGVVGGVGGLVVRVDGWGGQEPVRVVVVGAYAKGHLMNYGASLGVRETIGVLEERGRARGEEGVVRGAEGSAGRVGQQGVSGSRRVCRAAVGQVCKGVDIWGDEGMGSQRPKVAVPLFAAVV